MSCASIGSGGRTATGSSPEKSHCECVRNNVQAAVASNVAAASRRALLRRCATGEANRLFTMHGNEKVLGAGLARFEHRLHDDAMRCAVVGGYHEVAVGAQ